MSDDLHKHDDDHWRRLAEELGLPLDEFAPAAPRGESRSAERPPAQNEIRDAGPPPQRSERPTEEERPRRGRGRRRRGRGQDERPARDEERPPQETTPVADEAEDDMDTAPLEGP